jgi:chemotaxis protein histidine kinase CheA
MRFSYLLALTVVLSLAGVQWYQTTQYICPVPINYRLGEIDSSFTLSEVEAKQYIEEATAVWEDVAAQDLFIYNDDAAFTINFIFDERQAMADAQIFDRDRLDSIAEQNEAFRTQIADIQSSYQRRQTAFNAAREAYDSRLQSYNDEVRQANDRGGATPAVFAELELERVSLASESEELRVEADALNNLAQQLNELSTEGNRLVETYNQEVRTYNADYGATHEFTQGDYRGGEINIYKFSNQFELVSVLAHEFGHALGIDHIEEPGSLMYYLLDDELDSMPTLSDSDIAAYQTECADQGFSASVRGFIREALAKL